MPLRIPTPIKDAIFQRGLKVLFAVMSVLFRAGRGDILGIAQDVRGYALRGGGRIAMAIHVWP